VIRRSAHRRMRAMHWLYLVLCLGVGPGLVTNTLLKDQWGRARPAQIVEFGGSKTFTPPLLPADQCARNCSFVSGEAASMFAVFYAAALIVPQWSLPTMIAGTMVGLAAGLVRVVQGGHFLSDVVFAGVFMAVTAAGLHRLMFGRSGAGATARTPPGVALDHAAGWNFTWRQR
jgi:lipid A 4'-phosphatase